MRVRFWLPAVTSAILALIGFSAGHARAGSFFGPTCYGSSYAYEYPNRANNVFGFGPCTQCQAKHPLFKHRWGRKHPDCPNDGAPANAMMTPNKGMPVNGMPANAMLTPNGAPNNNAMMTVNGMSNHGTPVEYVQAPVMEQIPVAHQAPVVQQAPVAQPAPVVWAPAVQQAPAVQTPAQPTSMTTPAPMQTVPTDSSRAAPTPAPLPKGPASPQTPVEEPSNKPPF